MTAGSICRALTLAVCLSALLSRGVGARQVTAPVDTLLDVPYVGQTDHLCGGAAAAMVLRYWGARDIHAADFASLVDTRAEGIRGDVLTNDLRRRGWQALPLRGDADTARTHLTAGRPLVVLVQEEPGHYHYVVLVGWADGAITLHDSARAPFRVVTESEFTRMWAPTDNWTLLILPREDASPAHDATQVRQQPMDVLPPSRHDACAESVARGVRLAQAGDRASADEVLSAAVARCPTSATAARELGGLRFVQSRWQEAADLAARAAEAAPEDDHAWRLLASSRFIDGDADDALRAWNRVGEPRIDLIRVAGLERTYHGVVASLSGLRTRAALTADDLRRARRRVALLPAAAATRVGYRPVSGGLADVEVAIVERHAFPRGLAMAATGIRALTDREAAIEFVGPAGPGTRWNVSWRWWEARPRLGLTLLAPIAFGRTGLWRVEGLWERQTYATSRSAGETPVREQRRRVALGYGDWITADTRVDVGVAFDRWNRRGSHLGASGSIDQRLANDRVAVRLAGSRWTSLAAVSFGTGSADVAWRSSPDGWSASRPLLTARAGLQAASAQAPFDVWPGAGVGHARDVLARAHPLLTNGVVTGPNFGRTLAHAGAELMIGRWNLGPVGLRPTVFADVARAWHTLDPGTPPETHVDVGAGLRVHLAGQNQTLRIDVAQGLRDGQRALSIGWQPSWPGFP